jgi:hypothetical protein
MYPKAAVDVSMLVPSISHAQIPNPVKCKIPSQSPGFSSFQPKNYPLDSTKTQNYYGLFDTMIDRATGASLSEDLSFCKRWSDLGGEIWIDTQSKLTHTGPVTFSGDFASQFK